VLAENICNSDTLNFNARDLVEPKFSPTGASAGGSMGSLAMTPVIWRQPAADRVLVMMARAVSVGGPVIQSYEDIKRMPI
jgi:hypothetical protein